jgi:hypothetical protein
MGFFELDDVFTYQDANDIKKLWAGDTAPASPGSGEVWLDTSATPNQLKRYNGSSWDTIGELTAGDLLNLIKTVDGSGSGLDADMLDGQEGPYYRNADNLNAGTVPLARIPTTLTGKDADKLDGQEGSYYQDASNLNSGTIPSARLSASGLLTLIKTVDGSGSGLDADKLDGQEGSYYRNADNLNAGTVGRARLGALWRDNQLNETGSPYIQTGYQITGGGVNFMAVVFDVAFTDIPKMFGMMEDKKYFCNIANRSTTGCTIWLYFHDGTPANNRYAMWLAIGRKT